MTIIGFDISKDKLDGARINRSGQIKESYCIPNNKEAISDFLNTLVLKFPKALVASESTANYHYDLARMCLKSDIPFHLLNPITTKQFIRATVRKKKTDKSDAEIVAKLTLQGEGTRVTESYFSDTKAVTRINYKLSCMLHSLGQIEHHLDKAELSNPAIKEKIKRIKSTVQEEILDLRKITVSESDAKIFKLLTSIPGIGPTLAPVLIAEIGDIHRFGHTKQLVAFAGLDPKVNQSGTSLRNNTHITKRGSSYLRRSIYVATSIAQRWDPELKSYYEKKRGEGKRYKEATVANAKKLICRIYAVWKRQTPYVVKTAS